MPIFRFMVILGLCSLLVSWIAAQERGSTQNECGSLQNAGLPTLLQFLERAVPDETNGDCISSAIRKIGAAQYEAAIPTLAKLLDFHRPASSMEKRGYILHPHGIDDLYPAAGALSMFGKKALPILLTVLRSDSYSTVARENAVFVWMEIYRQSDEHPKGVALLRQQEINAKDVAIKERLRSAVSTALTWCNPPEETACRRAAATGAQ